MNFLHRFLPQPCFDNAGGGGASGGGGNTRGTMKGDTGMDSVGNFSGGFGQNAVSGAARSGAGSRDGYGYGAAGAVGQNQPARGSGLAARSAAPPSATVTVAPPVRSYAPPPVTVAPPPTPAVAPPAAMPTAPAAPVSMAPNAYGPNAIGSAPMSNSQVASLAASNAASAPVAAAPTRSMSPATRSTPAQAAAARSVGQQAAAQRAGQAVSATPGGRAGGVGTPGVGGGFGPSVSNAAAKSDRGLPSVDGGGGGISGGRANAGGLGGMGNAANVGLSSNVAGKSDRGVPGLNARSDIAGLLGSQRIGGTSSMAQNNPAPARAAQTTPGAQFGNIGLGIGLEAIGQDPVLAGRAAALAQSSPQALARGYSSIGRAVPQGLPQVNQNSRAVQNAVRGLDLSRPNYSGTTPNDGGPAFGSLVGGGLSPATPSATPPANSRRTQEDFKELLKGDGYFDNGDYGFYSSDNSYEGVNFPSVNDAYPTSASALPGGYSSTPQGSWSRNAPSFDTPMEAAQNMGIMDQMRALNMFTRGGTPPARNDGTNRGGNSKSNTKERNRVKKAIAEAIAPKKSGWSPYTGSSRFANWTPIMKALMNG